MSINQCPLKVAQCRTISSSLQSGIAAKASHGVLAHTHRAAEHTTPVRVRPEKVVQRGVARLSGLLELDDAQPVERRGSASGVLKL